ncbi:MAG TPA: SpoIIE family protein phosphatase [Bacteroidota bacterium]|nr:SpoIIE family protein phosphatase [Bacteroidota bacterium]
MTDGVTEARNSSEEEYGLERLKALVSSHANSSAQHLRDRIIEDIRQFTGQTPQHDDLTLVVAKLT